MKKVLFIPYHGPTVHMFHNVKKELDKKNIETLFISPSHMATEALEKRNIPYKKLESYNTTIKNILLKEKPDIVITPHNLNPIGYLFIRKANKMKKKTLLMHEGGSEVSKFLDKKKPPRQKNQIKKISDMTKISMTDRIDLFNFKIKKKILGKQYVAHSGCKIITVMSEQAKEFLQSMRINKKSEIIITGQPRFDDIINQTYNKNKILKELHITNKKKNLILLLTSIFVVDGIWSQEKMEKFLINLKQILNKIENIELLVKIHPRENISFYTKIFQNKVKVIKNYDLYKLIYISDIVISLPSTTTVESLLFKKPVIVPDFLTRKPYSSNFKSLIGCNDFLEISNKINDLMNKDMKILNEDLSYTIYKDDGKSSERVAKVIEESI